MDETSAVKAYLSLMNAALWKAGLIGLAMTATLGACGTTTTTGTAPTSTVTVAGSPHNSTKVSANKASESEIAAALAAAGVANASHWAQEVVEYRPYDSADTSLARLRKSLAKYKPGEETMTKILGALRP